MQNAQKEATHKPALAQRIEAELERVAEVNAVVEVQGDRLVISGRVDTAEAKQAATDIAAALATGMSIDNDLEVEGTLPVETSDFYTGVDPSAELPQDVDEIGAADSEIEPDFQQRRDDETSLFAAGVDVLEESDTVYTPPTDPVITTNARDEVQVLGGFSTSSMDDVSVARSSDGTLGDEAIEDAIRRELREDATTTALQINVSVRNGVVHLTGVVADVVDAENAEEVAARVPGVREVVEQLEVAAV